jgi:hypothetical protein
VIFHRVIESRAFLISVSCAVVTACGGSGNGAMSPGIQNMGTAFADAPLVVDSKAR